MNQPVSPGTAEQAPDALKVRLEMQESADAARLQQVVEEHLQRFGFQETLRFDWRDGPGGD